MSIICMHCKPATAGGRQKLPKSRVIESRVTHSHVLFNGRSRRTRTMMRTRKCECGFRWQTLEYALPAKRGSTHGQFGKRFPHGRSQAPANKETITNDRPVPN